MAWFACADDSTGELKEITRNPDVATHYPPGHSRRDLANPPNADEEWDPTLLDGGGKLGAMKALVRPSPLEDDARDVVKRIWRAMTGVPGGAWDGLAQPRKNALRTEMRPILRQEIKALGVEFD